MGRHSVVEGQLSTMERIQAESNYRTQLLQTLPRDEQEMAERIDEILEKEAPEEDDDLWGYIMGTTGSDAPRDGTRVALRSRLTSGFARWISGYAELFAAWKVKNR